MVGSTFFRAAHYVDICAVISENTDSMYRKILEDPLLFGPEIGIEARGILTGLLTRDPSRRLGANGAAEIKKHPFFGRHLDFKKLLGKEIQPPFKPSVASPVVSFIYLSFQDALKSINSRMFPTLTPFSRRKKHLTALSKTLNCHRPSRTNLLVCEFPYFSIRWAMLDYLRRILFRWILFGSQLCLSVAHSHLTLIYFG